MAEFDFAQNWHYFVIAAIVCYLIGCFNFAVLISRSKKKDIRKVRTGNPGTMNMTRTFGLKVGIINFLCDAVKGGGPALAGYFIFKDYVFAGTAVSVADFARYFFGAFVIIGHVFPVTMKFKGGKGIASTVGLFAFALPCENWWYIFIIAAFIVCLFVYIAVTEWGAMGSLIGVSGLTVWQAVIFALRYSGHLSEGWVIGLFAVLLFINLLTWAAHRKNIVRLLAGEEHRTSVIKHKNRN